MNNKRTVDNVSGVSKSGKKPKISKPVVLSPVQKHAIEEQKKKIVAPKDLKVKQRASTSIKAQEDDADDEVGQERLVYDRLPRSDENGMKHTLLFNVLENEYHLKGQKGKNFESLARSLEGMHIQGLTKVSGSSLSKKYDSILKQVQHSLESGYIVALEGPGSENDNGLSEEEDSSDSDIPKKTRPRNKPEGRFDGTEPFERIALVILQEIAEAEEKREFEKSEKIHKENNLSIQEDFVLDLIELDTKTATSSASNNNANTIAKTKASRRAPQQDDDMEELKKILLSTVPPPPVTPIPAAARDAGGASEVVTTLTDKLLQKNIHTVGDALATAGVSQQGQQSFISATGIVPDKPVKKLAVLFVDMQQDKNGTLMKNVATVCQLNPSDSVDLIDLLRM